MGGTPTVRLPYPMQIGSGTWDLEPGITFAGKGEKIGWGAQLSGRIRIGDNDQDYSLGNKITGTTWISYALNESASISGRLLGETQGRVDGIDAMIRGPVQTANPDFQGGDKLTALAGFTVSPGDTFSIGVEAGLPIVQDLNGPQMPTDWTLTVGLQAHF